MTAKIPPDFSEVHVLHELEIERLELLAVAVTALLAHAESLEAAGAVTTERRAA